jgi:peptidoglycan/xylan/chitin deacetylase (PgdA/CDA1 family)
MHLSPFSVLIIGAAASPVAQPQQRQSTVPTGSIIQSCTVPGVFALTFDDGPFMYTEQVLDTLAASGVKATFFLNGKNYGSIYDYTSTVQRMITDGHQVGSHTYVVRPVLHWFGDIVHLHAKQIRPRRPHNPG